jgi:hypothetical protein
VLPQQSSTASGESQCAHRYFEKLGVLNVLAAMLNNRVLSEIDKGEKSLGSIPPPGAGILFVAAFVWTLLPDKREQQTIQN